MIKEEPFDKTNGMEDLFLGREKVNKKRYRLLREQKSSNIQNEIKEN